MLACVDIYLTAIKGLRRNPPLFAGVVFRGRDETVSCRRIRPGSHEGAIDIEK